MSNAEHAKKVAKWMMDQVIRHGVLYQQEAVYDICERFGESFSYINTNGNQAIDKSVLDEFRKLSTDTVVWIRSERAWRLRADFDETGRSQ